MTSTDTSSKLRRNRFLQRAAGIAIAVLIAASAIGAYASLLSSLNNLTATSNTRTCSQQLLGYVFQSVAAAFEAPPSPDTARLATVRDIRRASDRYADATAVCKRTGNHPQPLTPTDPLDLPQRPGE